MRIDDVLIRYGQVARSKVKKIVKQGRVTVDGKVIAMVNYQVDSNLNEVKLDGQHLTFPAHQYLI